MRSAARNAQIGSLDELPTADVDTVPCISAPPPSEGLPAAPQIRRVGTPSTFNCHQASWPRSLLSRWLLERLGWRAAPEA